MEMPDYKKMYLTMMNAFEDTINRLVAAQQECEELYLSSTDEEENENREGE